MPFKVTYSLYLCLTSFRPISLQNKRKPCVCVSCSRWKACCGLNALKMLNCPKLEHELSYLNTTFFSLCFYFTLHWVTTDHTKDILFWKVAKFFVQSQPQKLMVLQLCWVKCTMCWSWVLLLLLLLRLLCIFLLSASLCLVPPFQWVD